MRWKFQYSLSSLLWFTLCLALAISSFLMYGRMEKAEWENMMLRQNAGLLQDEEPVVFCSWPEVEVDVVYHVTAAEQYANSFRCNYRANFIIRSKSPTDLRVHLPLLRASFCTPQSMSLSEKLDSPWKQEKTIVLRSGQSIEIDMPESGMLFGQQDFFKGKDSKVYGRWALVFGAPDGENPENYLVGTVLTKPIQWKLEIPKKDGESK